MTDYEPYGVDARPRRGPRTGLIVAALAFLAGLAAMAWLFASWDRARNLLPGQPPRVVAEATELPPRQPLMTGAQSEVAAVMTVDPAVTAALGSRVSELELRLDRVAERAGAAAGNAARAEGLLVAFAARRAVDRGLGLGYIEAQLRERFGANQPRAVATIVDSSREPVTLQDLQVGLDDLSPVLTTGPDAGGWWSAVREQLSGLVVVRKAGTPSPAPVDRLRYARRLLDAGQVDKALIEVSRLPGRAKATRWMAAARRYLAIRNALDMVETAAILQPRLSTQPPPLLPEQTPYSPTAQP